MQNPLIQYLVTSKEELEKVSWPSREVTVRYGTLIIAGSVLAAIFFGALDFGASHVVKAVIGARTQTASSAQAPATPTTEASPIELPSNAIEATDANGKKVDLDVKTLPLNAPNSAPIKK